MRRVITFAGTLAALILVPSGVAWADCHGNGDDVGGDTRHMGAPSSFQYMYWDKPGKRVRVVSNTDSGMNTNICLDAYLDWMTEENHYDARVARNCDPGSYRESDSGGDGYQPEPSNWGGRTVTGLQKAAGCKYVQNTNPPSLGDCEYVEPESVCNVFGAFAWTNKTHRVWLRAENGTIDYNNGGDVAKHDS
jgi:hypothetical protein